MKHVNELRPYDENDPTWRGMPQARTVGPQGDALILELQRLQHAFNGDDTERRARTPQQQEGRKARRPQPAAAGRKRPPPRVARKKGKVGRAFDISLSLLGLSPARTLQRRPENIQQQRPRRASEPEIAPPERPARPRSIVPDDRPLAMDLRASVPALDLSPQAGRRPGLSAATQVPAVVVPPTRMGQLVGTASQALTTGMTFIATRGTAAQLDDPCGDPLIPRVGLMFENELRTGLRVLLVAAVLGGGWLTLVPLAGAVVVPGNLVVQSDVKAIQHPTGGIVSTIKVDNGKHVAAGDLLVRLDATQVQANQQAVAKQLNEQRAKIARLSAERDGLDNPSYPVELTSRMDEPSVRSVIASENALFKARRSTRQSQKDLLQGRIAQLNQEIGGLEAQADSKSKQIELINGELAGVQDLYDKRLVPLTRLTTLQREAARIDGERGQLTSSIAETRSKISEAELQIVKTDQDFRTEVVKDLGEAQAKEGELVEKAVAARDQLDRIEIRAPNSGTVHQLSVHTIGGVVKAGETIMEVVPDSDELLVEAHVQPKDIDHVHTGQDAFVRFSAFNQRTTPQVTGQVSFVSPDITTDQRSNTTFYTIRVVMSEDEHHRLGAVQLIPGMQAEVFVQTGQRTMLSYLMKPIMEQWRRAFVEE